MQSLTYDENFIKGLQSNCVAVLDSVKGNKNRKFPGKSDSRAGKFALFPSVQPGFSISEGAKVFTIGSCFARNIEDFLAERGMVVPAAGFTTPEGETPGRPNRVLNQYNPGTMYQILKMVDAGVAEGGLYDDGDGKVLDGLLSTGGAAVPRERAIERRREVVELYRSSLADADLVVVTLGLVECWIDLEAGLFINQAPGLRFLRKDPERFRFVRLGYEECLELVRGVIARLTGADNRNVLLTVSPVPFGATMNSGDAVVENSYSKSLLRVVADKIVSEFASVDYFPSYEIVTSGGLRNFEDDNKHVNERVVARAVRHMIDHYVKDDGGDAVVDAEISALGSLS